MDRREALAALVSLPAATRINVARLKANDVIVIECEGCLSDNVIAMIKAHMRDVWPDHKCVVLGDGLKLRIVEGKS